MSPQEVLLEVNDTFAAEAPATKFVEHLLGTVQFNLRADPLAEVARSTGFAD